MSQPQQQSNNSCSMTGLLSILVQVGLGCLSFSVLIIKRCYEHPKRPWKIWILDISKQIVSQLLAHFINLTITLALSYDKRNSDQCLWYFITNIFDNTIGVAICIIMLKIIEKKLRKQRKFKFISGNYYNVKRENSTRDERKNNDKNSNNKHLEIKQININDNNENKQTLMEQDSHLKVLKQISINIKSIYATQEQNRDNKSNKSNNNYYYTSQQKPITNQPQTSKQTEQTKQQHINISYIINYKAWLIQLLIWNSIVFITKCFLFGLQFGLQKQLSDFSILILGWIQQYPVFELLLVIVVVPVIMNGLAYWVQDNFLMKTQKSIEEENLLQGNTGNYNIQHNDHIQQEDIKYQIQLKQKQIQNSHKNQFNIDNDKHIQFQDEQSEHQPQNKLEQFKNFQNFEL